VDHGGQGRYVGFLATSEVSPQGANAGKIAQWVLVGVVDGLNSTYFTTNYERHPPQTAWQRLLDDD